MKLPTKIPKRFWPYFWDVDAKKVNPSKKPLFVIQRLLDKGDTEGARWVRQNFPEEIIKDTFKTMRDFSPRIGSFWQAFLNIPITQVACLEPSYLAMRKTHWPF